MRSSSELGGAALAAGKRWSCLRHAAVIAQAAAEIHCCGQAWFWLTLITGVSASDMAAARPRKLSGQAHLQNAVHAIIDVFPADRICASPDGHQRTLIQHVCQLGTCVHVTVDCMQHIELTNPCPLEQASCT